jgi:glycosyltransferase involved in cell wall biosynthesis
MLDASVVICSHNPRPNQLSRALEALQLQTVPRDRWELIVIDNSSQEPIAGRWDLSWHPLGRHVSEPKLGLSSARQRGIAESSSRLIIFVDDDNVLAPDYIAQALGIEAECQFLGVWGSASIVPEFEVEPARHLRPLIPWLAIRDVERPVWGNSISLTDGTPVGAGLCVRRAIGEAYLELCRRSAIEIAGRKGSSLGGHEDFEICYLACMNGQGMGIFPRLKMLHLISRERVTDEYFRRLVENLTLSQFMLDYKWKGTLPRSPYSVRGVVSLLLNLVSRQGFDRQIFFAELRAVIAARRALVPVIARARASVLMQDIVAKSGSNK